MMVMPNPGPAVAAAPVRFEFVALVALLISLVALSTDIMLPGLPQIGAALGVTDPNGAQLIVTVFMAGLSVGQLFSGPLSDAYGRKMVVYGGLVIFLVGCVLSIASWSLESMLVGRFLQGLGAAAPRIVMVAIIRDQYAGRAMARVLSFAMVVFILVPAVAPALGQAIMLATGWRMMFAFLLATAIVGFIWFAFRQPETLTPDRRLPFSAEQILSGIRQTCGDRMAFGYTLAAGTVFGAFVGYLSSAQQIFADAFGEVERFPLYFAVLALAIGSASLTNSALVMRFGMRRLSHTALIVVTIASCAFVPVTFGWFGPTGLGAFLAWGMIAFFCFGILFGNFNALAMEPLGHIAGIGAAVVGSLTTFLALASGLLIGQLFDGTTRPLVTGFAVLGLAGLVIVAITERGRLFQATE